MYPYSWTFRGRNYRNRRNNRGRRERDDDIVEVDYTKSPAENMHDILSNLTKTQGVTEGRRFAYLNHFVKLITTPNISYDEFGFTAEEIMYCLRPISFSESTQLKNAVFRALRYFIQKEEHVDAFIKLKFDYLVARQITAAGIQLCRRLLVVCPSKFTHAPVRAIVSFTHPGHSDNLQTVALAFLAEIAILNPEVFITCGGVGAIVQSMTYLHSTKMIEGLLGSLLYLMNKPETRNKAGINLHCLTDSVYMDRWFNSKSSNLVPSNFRWCTTAMITLLRSWTGILHLCQGERHAVMSIVNNLYVPASQRPMLEALYKLLQLVQPDWTDEMSVALKAVDPSRWQNSYKLAEGFVASEALTLYPHLAKNRVNLVEMHKAVLLYCFLESNLLDAIVYVIVSDDTFLSVHATILLGELLHLVYTLLPNEVTHMGGGLPTLLSYAVRGRAALLGTPNRTEGEYSRSAQERAIAAVCAMNKLHKILRSPPSPSLYLNHVISWLNNKPYYAKQSFYTHGCDDIIKETGVLSNKDPFTWKWDIIRAVLKGHRDGLRKTTDSNRKMFMRRLVNFLVPGTGQYGRTEMGQDRKKGSRMTQAALDLLYVLVQAPEDSDCHKLFHEFLSGIGMQLLHLTLSKSAHNCFLSPQNLCNSLCQDYFLMIGHLTRFEPGRKTLEKFNIYSQLMELVKTTNHECYIKLIISTLDYAHDETARKILVSVLESKTISSRQYATRFLHSLIRLGIGHNETLMNFVIGLVVELLNDESLIISEMALDILQEACDNMDYIESIVSQKPCLLGLGDRGLHILVRCLSTETGFKALQSQNFVTAQLSKWAQHHNYRYVTIVEKLLCDSLIKSGGNKDTFLPPHLYQQLAYHPQGLNMVLSDPNISKLTQVLDRRDLSSDQGVLEVKAALYALSGICAVMDISVVSNIIKLATESDIYSIRATAFIALCNVATSKQGSEKLQLLDWHPVTHNRHDREGTPNTFLLKNPFASDDEPCNRDSFNISDHNSEGEKSILCDLPEESVDTVDFEDSFWGVPGGKTQRIREKRSATLPYSSGAPTFYHNRSYSESKAEQSDSEYKFDGRKSRSNSYTDSSTSGDSNYGVRHYSIGDRVQTLSPIPSTGSLANFHTSLNRKPSISSNFSRNSLRSSRYSILKSFEPQPSSLPSVLITYGELYKMSPISRARPKMPGDQWEDASSSPPDFSIIEPGDEESSIGPSTEETESGLIPVFMGVSVPTSLSSIFPKEDKNLVNSHVAFMSENLNIQGRENLKNINFHKKICFLGDKENHNTMVSVSDPQFLLENEDELELEKETIPDNSADSSITDIPNIAENPMPLIFRSRDIIRSDISMFVEQLSNPILHKSCKQCLLQIKQAHGDLFEDVCVFSDVCYILSTCSIRFSSRDLIHELFDTPFNQIWTDSEAYFHEVSKKWQKRIKENSLLPKD